MSNIACLLVFTTENSTITSWPPSITSLMPVQKQTELPSADTGDKQIAFGASFREGFYQHQVRFALGMLDLKQTRITAFLRPKQKRPEAG
jgi:hypothetical protein